MKKFKFTEEISNEAMNSIMGGASSARFSLTISLAQNAKEQEEKGKDSDSDA